MIKIASNIKRKSTRTCLCLTLLSLSIFTRASAEELHIATAANFTSTLTALVTLFEQNYPQHSVITSSGSSGKLFAQIEHGAPFDIFLAANKRYPMQLENDGYGVKGSRFTYAIGTLVLWSPTPNLFNDAEKFLRKGDISQFTIANPKTAPYGTAAHEYMKKIGVWSSLEKNIIRGNNVGQAFQFVASQSVPVGFVALSQVKSWIKKKQIKQSSLTIIPSSLYSPIEQQTLILNSGKDKQAVKDFMRFLLDANAKHIIEENGYQLPIHKEAK